MVSSLLRNFHYQKNHTSSQEPVAAVAVAVVVAVVAAAVVSIFDLMAVMLKRMIVSASGPVAGQQVVQGQQVFGGSLVVCS